MPEGDHEDAVQNDDGWYVTPPPKPRPPMRRVLFAISLVFSGAFLGALSRLVMAVFCAACDGEPGKQRLEIRAETRNEYVWRPMTEEEFDEAARGRAIIGTIIGGLLVGGGVAVNLIRGERL